MNSIRHFGIGFCLAISVVNAYADSIPTSALPEAKLPAPTLADSLPERWQYVSEYVQTLPADDRWWQTFNDPVLNRLIALGIDHNYNILTAIHRIEAARQAVKSAQSGYYPTIGVSAGWVANRQSGALISGGRATNMNYFNLGVSASWEADVFGRVTAKAKRAKTLYNASRADYAATMVSLCGEIALNYAQLRAVQARIAVAKAHIVLQDSVLKIASARFEAELNSKLDVEQASTTYYSTKASLPGLESQAAAAINALALLVGEFPEQIAAELSAPGPLPDYHQIVAVGMPTQLIRRRPDIVAAEYQLAAAAQNIGIAKKDFLPVLSIQGSLGTEAHKIGKLFSGKSFTYSIAPTLSWTVFDGFARRAAVASAREEMKASLDQYNLAILTAVQEADNAMASYKYALQEAELIDDVLTHAKKAFDLSLELYRSGLTSFTNLSTSQIAYLQYADSLVAARADALSALIRLYEALGGGWTENS